MKTLRKTARVLGLALAVAGLSGCLTGRSIVRVEDHPEKQVTKMETMDIYMYFPGIFFVPRHQFWECTQGAGALSCAKTCGEGTPFTCPMAFGGFGSGASNVR